MSKQEELVTDLNAIQQTELIGQFTKLDAKGNADNDQSMFVLTKKIKETRLSFF